MSRVKHVHDVEDKGFKKIPTLDLGSFPYFPAYAFIQFISFKKMCGLIWLVMKQFLGKCFIYDIHWN